MNETQRLLDDTVTRLFGEAVTPERIVEAEAGGWLGSLWDAVSASGLLTAHLDEAAGGAGASWLEAFVVARACGRHAVPLPVVETMLASWLLAHAGLDVPAGPLGIAVDSGLEPGARGPSTLARVPWGRRVGHVVIVAGASGGTRIGCASTTGASITEGYNLAREPRDTLAFAGDARWSDTMLPGDVGVLYGAMLRAAQMAGALEAILDLSVGYANERVQFGRPIGQFQVIQQELARLAGLVAMAGMAAEVAARAASEADPHASGVIGAARDPAFEIATAKIVTGDAAEHGPRIAHQVHGAIGFTYEHRLHFFTRRLWAWRADFGTPDAWAERLGEAAFAADGEQLWPLVTAR